MMKLGSLLAVAATALMLSAPLFAGEKGKDILKDIKCPVSGKQAVKCAVAYKGGKAYFCCGKCAKAFKEDLKKDAKERKFTAKANHQLYATKQAKLVKCAFGCKKLDTDTTIDIAGTKVWFGCAACKSKVENADDPIEAVFNEKQFKTGFQVIAKKKKEKK